jgi:hypothetical protein
MKELDRVAEKDVGMSVNTMIENDGRTLAEVIVEMLELQEFDFDEPQTDSKAEIVVLCGARCWCFQWTRFTA